MSRSLPAAPLPRLVRLLTAVLVACCLALMAVAAEAAPGAATASTKQPLGTPRPAWAPDAGTASPAVSAPTGPYVWPTGAPAEVVRGFDPPWPVWSAGHRGVDLAHEGGAPILAANEGIVSFAGIVVDRPVVSIQHADGIRTTYEPVTPVLTRGDAVRAGEVIGYLELGHCDRGTPTCLHFGARRGTDNYIDPLGLLGADVLIRLLPAAPERAARAR